MMSRRKHPSPHRWLLRAALLVLSALPMEPLLADATVPVYDYDIVNRYPHNTQSFTQGLLIENGRMYENTGRYGQSALMETRLEDGAVLRSRPLGQRYFGEGIAVVEDRVFQLTWRENTVFVYDLETFEPLDAHYLPTEGWGLTYDGTRLLLSDGSDRLYYVDPDGFQITGSVPVTLDGRPLHNINELEYIHGEVWANVWMTERIARIDPQTGTVTGVVDLAGLRQKTRVGGAEAVLNGIAWDAEQDRIFVTGKLWGDLFEITVRPRD